MTVSGSIAEWQEFSGKEAKLPCRFRVSALVLLMTGDGWIVECPVFATGRANLRSGSRRHKDGHAHR